jgi:hypothetical protein
LIKAADRSIPIRKRGADVKFIIASARDDPASSMVATATLLDPPIPGGSMTIIE